MAGWLIRHGVVTRFGAGRGGDGDSVPELPEKRQSVRPNRSVLVGALLIAVVLAAVWFAVSAAVEAGGEDCPAQREQGAVSDKCS